MEYISKDFLFFCGCAFYNKTVNRLQEEISKIKQTDVCNVTARFTAH